MSPVLYDALAAGATVITPNRRLARHLRRDFDQRQLAAGRRAWPTVKLLPYSAWLEILWERCLETSASSARLRLISATQSACLWQRVVADANSLMLDASGAARIAAEAWALLHGWGEGGESWRAWRRDGADIDDAATFSSWAEVYQRQLRQANAIDTAQLPDAIAACAPHIGREVSQLVFTGFLDFNPQQQRLAAALAAAGSDVRHLEAVAGRLQGACRTTASTPSDEWRTALGWARELARTQPLARIGIVIENLAQHREEIVALADEVLCPERLLGVADSTQKPFEVSLGSTLAEVPLVNCAMQLLALAAGRVPAHDVAAMLRSPYLADASGWVRRAAVERHWLEEGRREATLGDAIAALQRCDPALAARWRDGRAVLRDRAAATPREWTDQWRVWLASAGWPEGVTLDSAEYQALGAWEALLAEFAKLGVVAPALGRSAAVGMLRTMAQERVFQPQGTDARIQLLGVLEASGLSFDALWVTGMAADSWPAAPNPNPLLPRAWQHARRLPHASADWELERARQLTTGFAMAAPTVVFSCAERVDDHPLALSALVLDYPARDAAAPQTPWTATIATSATLEAIVDTQAPPLAPGSRVPGGSRIIAAQSDCPFQAVARHRLRAEPWPTLSEGLSSRERGTLIHATMAALWNQLHDRASLAALDVSALGAHLDIAIARARGELTQARWSNLPAAVQASEAQRIAAIVRAWLDFEIARPPFTVIGIEAKASVELSQLEFSVRLDRVDALVDGGEAIIDYKTGRAESLAQWFVERPRAAQLGMYALARSAATASLPVRALAYVQLRPDIIGARGVSADATAWPGLTDVLDLPRFRDWNALDAWWRDRLGALASEIGAGWAAVTPRAHPSPCRNCGLQPLCRIDSVIRADDEGTDDE